MNNVGFSPDGRHLVTPSGDHTAIIWEFVAVGRWRGWQEKAIVRHNGWVSNASFSPDGRHLVSTSFDGTAKIWGFFDGEWQEKATIRHSYMVDNARFSPDGRYLVTFSRNTAKIWLLKGG